MLEVYQNIYLIRLPLPQNPLKSINSYLIKGEGDDGSLLIDTGFNHPETEAALMHGLKELGVSPYNMDIFLTHAHADHSGLAGKLKNDRNTVYSSSRDGLLLNDYVSEQYWAELVKMQRLMGFPYSFVYTDHPGFLNRNERHYERVNIDPGDTLTVGGYEFQVLDLSGHTPGQIGLYEQKHRLLFSGDHLLQRITPNLEFLSLDYDCLGAYLYNLRKVNDLGIEFLFSAHRELIPNISERTREMLMHHENRLYRTLEIISDKPCNAWSVAAGITWDYLGGDFLLFPPPQQWFAVSETLAHLHHLFVTRSDIRRQSVGDMLYFSLRPNHTLP